MTRPETREAVAEALWRADDYDLNADPDSHTARELRPEYMRKAEDLLDAIDAGQVPGLATSEKVAAAERARLVWWLRSGASGPAIVSTSTDYLRAVTDLADAIEQHPERFAEAPCSEVDRHEGGAQ